MKKFLVPSSWSRKAAIGSMLIVAFAVVGCDDSSSASAGQNDEPGVESSSSSVTQSDVKQSSSSEKTGTSSSSSKDIGTSSSSESDGVSSSSGKESVSSSSSADKVEPSSSFKIGCKSESEDNCEYGELIDGRDGRIYKTVKIGGQVWMAENLNYAYTEVPYNYSGFTSDSTSWCYSNDVSNCAKYGRLYTWAAAIDSVKRANDVDNPQDCGFDKTCTLPAKVQGVCPSDWHLPTYAEWDTLLTAVGNQSAGKMLESTSGWYGVDAFGFSALPAGHRNNLGLFNRSGKYAYFWSSTEYNSDFAYYMGLDNNYKDASLGSFRKYNGFSVRCVKD